MEKVWDALVLVGPEREDDELVVIGRLDDETPVPVGPTERDVELILKEKPELAVVELMSDDVELILRELELVTGTEPRARHIYISCRFPDIFGKLNTY